MREDFFNRYERTFDSGMEAFNRGDAKEAKRLLSEASTMLTTIIDQETDETQKESYVKLNKGIKELIDEHLTELPEDVKLLIAKYKELFDKGFEAFKKGDLDVAKTFMLEASEISMSISQKVTNVTLKEEYRILSENTLNFVNKRLSKSNTEVSKSEFKAIANEEKTIKMADVIGLDDVKEEIYYKLYKPTVNPRLAETYNIKPGGKVLLYGPPGTGKTHVARAIAGVADAKFYTINCQDLIDKYMGESSKKIDALFEQVQKDDRAIIFFDEFDAIAAKRGDGGEISSEMSRIVTTLLTKIDGFKKANKDKMLMLIAATNKPWDIDPAMLRGGRFDTQIYVGLPDFAARKAMIEKAFEGVPVAEDFSADKLAKALDGFGGGDVVSVCEKIRLEAYKKAATANGEVVKVTAADCRKALKKQRNVITPEMLQSFENYKDQFGANVKEA